MYLDISLQLHKIGFDYLFDRHEKGILQRKNGLWECVTWTIDWAAQIYDFILSATFEFTMKCVFVPTTAQVPYGG